jgi:hypothetical protein
MASSNIYYKFFKYKKVPKSEKFKYYAKTRDIYSLKKNYSSSLKCYKKPRFYTKEIFITRLKFEDMFLKAIE